MTKSKKQKWLKAIDELRQHYYRRKYMSLCPFCNFHCSECLWNKFENLSCIGYASRHFGTANVADMRHFAFFGKEERWRKDSLKRLTRWIKKLKEE